MVKKVDEILMVQVCWWILLSIFLESVPKQPHQDLVLFFVIATGSFRTPRFAFENKDFRVGLFKARPSHSKHLFLSFRSIHFNVTAAFLKVSLTSRTEVFPFRVLVRSCWAYNMKYQ